MSPWLAPPRAPELRRDEVHVYRIDLAAAAARAGELRRWLRPDELERAARFVFEHSRSDYIGARGSLRRLLARYTGLAPDQHLFEYTKYGKPSLVAAQGGDRLRFNLSHSRHLALVAVTEGREVGADVEWIRPDFTGEEIWERFFSLRERDALRALLPAQRDNAFFQCWTRKEAYIKGAGPGLSIPLDSFDVTLGPGVPARLLATRPDVEEAARWTLAELEPGPGYEGAGAVEGCDWQLRCWQWDG